MQDVLCPQSCPMKCSLIITVRNIAGKINYITIDKTVKNKPNKKGTPRKRATQGHLFPRIVLLPMRLQGVSKTSWKRALVCGFTYFGLNQSAAIILLSNGGKSILAHSGFSLGILMLERVTRRLHDAETTKWYIKVSKPWGRLHSVRASSNFSSELLFRLDSLVRIRHLSLRNLKL